IREGEQMTLSATIALLDEDGEPALPELAPGEEPEGTELPDLGLTISPLSQSARVDFGILESVEGVLVTEVAPDGQAAGKGIARGDVIVEVGQEPVLTPAEVEEHIAAAVDAGRRSVLFLVHSQGELRFVPLTLGQD
ncbi:MAG TPA: PDZ domain-containing protein, partial [Paracoccaceae bacterium]|nr:PDZ domain-containing protein [Paracoccaceae bacterium]